MSRADLPPEHRCDEIGCDAEWTVEETHGCEVLRYCDAHHRRRVLARYPNTVVALGELRDGAPTEQCVVPRRRYTIGQPESVADVAGNLMSGPEALPHGTPVLVIALPDVEPERVQRILRAVQEAKYSE